MQLPYLGMTGVGKAIEENDRASDDKRCGLIQPLLLFLCQSHSYHTYHMKQRIIVQCINYTAART